MTLNVLDTFAGAGGFSLGFHLAGFNIIGGIEIDKWAADTFSFNHKNAIVLNADIQSFTESELKKIFSNRRPNVILGGPPCQGFSICKRNSCDPKDPRNSLFTEFLRFAKIFTPEFLILENVPNLIKAKTHSKLLVIDIIKDELHKLGYHVYIEILQATDYGIPQIRRRLFVIASYRELKRPFPQMTHSINIDSRQQNLLSYNLNQTHSLWEAISDLPNIDAGEGQEEQDYTKEPTNSYQIEMREGSRIIYNHVAMNHTKRMVERFAAMSWGDSVSDVPHHLRPYKRNGKGCISQNVYDQNNRRMHPNRPCHTIPASFYANFVHPFKNRNFTAREGARIQSFPDWFIFKGKPTVVSHNLLQREGRFEDKHLCQYNQIGNAVPPLMAKAIALNILEQIK